MGPTLVKDPPIYTVVPSATIAFTVELTAGKFGIRVWEKILRATKRVTNKQELLFIIPMV